jgi:hypothetical protein
MPLMRIALTAFAFFLFTLTTAHSQNLQGSVTGTIADANGALMPGVRLEAKNTGTGNLYQVASTSTGNYTFSQLPPGTYELSASVPGFRRYLRTAVAVIEAQVIRIDIVLEMLSSDEILTNDSVLQLLKAGIAEDLIIAKIRDSQHNFDLSVQGMVSLKEGGASNRLMQFLMDPAKPAESMSLPGPASTTTATAQTKESPKTIDSPSAKTEPALPKEIGIYVKTENRWVEMQTEAVVWETGGSFKRFATAGIVQGDVNGKLKGAHSNTILTAPLEFVVITPEGVAITEYQLIHLRKIRKDREFRTVTGGVFSTTGATRDAIPFEGTKVINRAHTVKLPALDEGDYGFLPPTASSPGSSSNVGKMYTFLVK